MRVCRFLDRWSTLAFGGRGECSGGVVGRGGLLLAFCISVLFSSAAIAYVEPNDVLLLVNENSPTSRYVAKLYRQYYPEITDSQVIYLDVPDGCVLPPLADCSGPNSTAADEIITREEYEHLIAEPVRTHLIDHNMVDTIKVIITTAGLPYRIEDEYYGNTVTPGGGTAYAGSLIGSMDAASVESELTTLFQTDPNNEESLWLWDRAVNPYQAYRDSGIELFERDILGNLDSMVWRYPRKVSATHYPPVVEGSGEIYGRLRAYGVQGRTFSAGDIYLTSRLDGPKQQGQSAVFAVRQMLERSMRASSDEYGINPAEAVVVFDDATWVTNYNKNRIYNLDRYEDFIIWEPNTQQPPDTYYIESRDDYDSGFEQMTGQIAGYEDVVYTGLMSDACDLTVICDRRNEVRTSQADLAQDQLVVAATGLGRNGDEASAADYITHGGPGGGPLFNLAYGAVFYSIESFNGATMFSDVPTSYNQGKIIDFLSIGGCGAIGHTFEPHSDASIDTEFFFYNLLADADSDGYADMSFIEAAFTAVPYLSWAEVVIGDPLMHIAYGPGGQAEGPAAGDIDGDGVPATMADLAVWTEAYLGSLYTEQGLENYNDLCDMNADGWINLKDFAYFAELFR